MKKHILFSLLLLLSYQIKSAVFYVNDGSTTGDIYTLAAGSNTLTSGPITKPYLTLTYALANSGYAAGDTIYVDAGTYNNANEGGNTIPLAKAGVKIIGAGISKTIFDGTNYMSSGAITNWYLLSILSNNVDIRNMTIKNYNKQGAIDVTASTSATDSSRTYFTNTFFDANQSHSTWDGVNNTGGAVWVAASTKPAAVYFTNCHFNQNLAETGEGGGAIYAKAASTVSATIIMEGCRLTCNNTTGVDLTTYDGGAILLKSTAGKFNNCFFSGNRVNDRKGGAIYSINSLASYLPVNITNSIFASNRGRQGVAIFTSGNINCAISNSLFYGNTTTSGFGNGGTINCETTTNMSVVNSTIANNLSLGSDGSGLAVESATSYNVLNSIIWGNQVGNVSAATISATYCDIQAVGDLHSGTTGNIASNPLFTSASNFTLQAGSPAINAGTLTGAPLSDLTGALHSGNPDMGAFELNSVYPTTSVTCGLFLNCSNPAITSVAASNVICSGNTFNSTLVSSPSGASYNWISASVAGVSGHANSGNGNIHETLTLSGSSSVNVTYTITPMIGACVGASTVYTVTVVPAPNMTSANTASLCSETALNLTLTSNISSTYSWIAGDNTNTNGESLTTQSGGTINDQITNNSTSAQVVTYTVTPSSVSGSCPGAAQTVSVTIHPKPSMTSSNTSAVCSGIALNIPLTSTVGSTYTWLAADNASTTGESLSNQTSSTINNTIINSGNTSTVVNYTITPTSTGGNCVGAEQVLAVTVNPTPSITSVANETVCSGVALNHVITSNTPSTYTWVASDNVNTNGESTSNQTSSNITDNITHSQSNSQDVFYTITPTSTSGLCAGTAQTLTVTVNPTPQLSVLTNPSSVCAGATVAAYSFSTNPVGANISWTNNNTNTGLSGSGTTNPISGFTAANVSTQENSVVTITPTLGACTGSSASYTLTVNPNPQITTNPTTQNPTSCGGNDGSLIGLVVTGAPTITYSWNGGTLSGPNLTSLTAGAYNLTATDANGCTVSETYSLNDPTTPAAPNFTLNNPSVCEGGSATLTITNPQIGETYNWFGPSGSLGQGNSIVIDPASLADAGSYNASTTSAGCTGALSSNPLTLTVNENPVLTITSNATSFCEDASLTLNASVTNPGGTASIAANGYQWLIGGTPIVGATSSSYTTNQAGTYQLSATNSNGCSTTFSSTTISLFSEPLLSANTAVIDSSNCLTGTGNISNVTVSGGAPDYTYNWFDASNTLLSTNTTSTTSTSLLNQAAGTYQLIAIDNNGCNDTLSATIVQYNNPQSPSIASNPANCSGSSLSPITLNGTGGTYTWYGDASQTSVIGNGNPFTPSLTNTDTLYVTETLHGCESAHTSVIVTINPTPTAPLANGANYCQGQTIADLNASGGTGTFNWYSDAALSNLVGTGTPYTSGIASTDTLYVTETSLGCTSISTQVIVTINALPAAPIISAGGPLNFCSGNTVTLSSSPTTGIVWTPTSSTDSLIVVSTSGNYTVNYTDVNGCSTTSAPISVTVFANPAAPTLSLSSGNGTFCAGGSATILANPSTGITWNNGSTAGSIVTQTGGVYSATYTDVNNCNSPSSSITITVNQNPQIASTMLADTAFCNLANGGIHSVAISGGTLPYSYQWISNGVTVGTDSILSNSPSGNYTLVVLDQNGCSDTTSGLLVPAGNGVAINLTSDLYFGYEPSTANLVSTTINGTASGYNWYVNGSSVASGSNSTLQLNTLTQGTYTTTVIAADPHGCLDTAQVLIVIESKINLIIPNVFTPNGDETNDVFIITAEGLKDLKIAIYDRWGILMYTQEAASLSWDGKTTSGERASDGTYYFIFSAKDYKENVIEKTGYLMLLK